MTSPTFATQNDTTLTRRSSATQNDTNSNRQTSATSSISDLHNDSPPTRPFSVKRRLRRASQPHPVVSGGSFKLRASSIEAKQRLPTRLYSSTSPESSSAEDSDEDLDDWEIFRSHPATSLEYLDLSVSLPYSVVSLRNQLLSYLSHLEARVRAFYQNNRSQSIQPTSSLSLTSFASVKPSSSTDADAEISLKDSHFAPFFSHLEALKEDLRKLASLLPSPPASFAFPTPPSFASNPGAALASRSQSLVQDWERLSSSFALPLPLRSGFTVALPRLPSASDAARLRAELPSLPAFPPFPHLDIDFAAVLEPFAMHLPLQAFSIASKIHSRFEVLQESVGALTWRDCLATVQGETPTASLAKRVETTLSNISARGRARANSVVSKAGQVVHDAEDRLYQMALDLAKNGQNLIRYEHLPDFWKNNEHILSGYRFIPITNWKALLRSTFQIHNETGNIYTHLCGLAIVILLFWPSTGLDDQTTTMDKLVQTLYLVAAAKCLLLSVSWHVMAGCSDCKWFERFACVDYTGIAWLVAASIWTTVYNGFYCQPNLALFYSLTTLLVGLVGATLPWASWFNKKHNKRWRVAVFLTMSFTSLLPLTHATFQHGVVKSASFFSPILPSLGFYIAGLVFYVTQIPESLAPGRFDLFGHSHQLWHLGIVLAIIFHYRAALVFHENRFEFSCALPQKPTTMDGTGSLWSLSFLSSLIFPIPVVSSVWSQGLDYVVAATKPVDHLLEKAGGMEGIAGLERADEMVLHWSRLLLGRIGNGAVERSWDSIVDWAQRFW